MFFLGSVKSTGEALLLEFVQSLVDFSFLKLADDFHVLLTDRVFFELIEFGGVVRKIKQIYFAFVLVVELPDVLFYL